MSITDLFDSIRRGDEAQIRALLAGDPKLGHSRNPEGASAVLWSVYTRHAELAPLLLAGRESDFFEACALGRLDRVTSLLREDQSLAAADSPDGFSALGLAVFFGHVEIALLLVERGADVNRASRNSFHVTPLHSAVESGKLELLDLLLTHGAKPDPEESFGATPLKCAQVRGNDEMVKRLLAAGADPERARAGAEQAGVP
ncbi:MAG TPA: ankyrin repeat domain-containing protein [Bryobacteraceae bacterium]|jgi:ankyrin repeat protein